MAKIFDEQDFSPKYADQYGHESSTPPLTEPRWIEKSIELDPKKCKQDLFKGAAYADEGEIFGYLSLILNAEGKYELQTWAGHKIGEVFKIVDPKSEETRFRFYSPGGKEYRGKIDHSQSTYRYPIKLKLHKRSRS